MYWGSEIGLPREEALGVVSLNNLEEAGSLQTVGIALDVVPRGTVRLPRE